jgi:hypothetical protein
MQRLLICCDQRAFKKIKIKPPKACMFSIYAEKYLLLSALINFSKKVSIFIPVAPQAFF